MGIDLVFLSPYASALMPALLITSFIWALSFGLLGNCLSDLPASFVALARMAGSLAVFLPFVRKVPFSHAMGMMGIGAVQFGGMYLCYIAAFHYLPSHQVALFTATTPIYVVLVNGLMKAGYDVKMSEVHGMSQRGGSVVTYVKYGDQVCSPTVEKGEADYILAFEQLEAARWLPYLKPDGKLIVNCLLYTSPSPRD